MKKFNKVKYQPELDGLRGLAVFLVIAYHSDIEFFKGGFFGVDIFFVISGYIITKILLKNLSESNFSFLNFYMRRVARIFPSLILTLLLIIIFGFIFYDLKQYDLLGKQIFFSSLGILNIYLSFGFDYFSFDPKNSPIIHLWSLCVEEQFYIFWPIIFVIIYLSFKKYFKKNLNFYLFINIFILILIFFILSELQISKNKNSSYFLTYSRAFEFLIGALFVSNSSNLYKLRDYSNLISITSLSIIFYYIFFVLKNSSNFLGLASIIPLFSVGILISSLKYSNLNFIFSSKYFVLSGLLSYPLYLFHLPLITFFKNSNLSLSNFLIFFFNHYNNFSIFIFNL